MTELENILVNSPKEKHSYKNLYGRCLEILFLNNGICKDYFKHKIPARGYGNDLHVLRLCMKPYGRYIPCVKSTQKHIVLICEIIWINKPYG